MGATHMVQRFERYWLEYHADSCTVELRRLGVRDAQMHASLPATPH